MRDETVQKWCAAVKHSSFDFLAFMSSESEQLKWKAEGLPSDRLSLENAIILVHGAQTPLLMDPGQRATEWVKRHMKELAGLPRDELIEQRYQKFRKIGAFVESPS